jgi:multiple sugar transport system substrate-binding protein
MKSGIARTAMVGIALASAGALLAGCAGGGSSTATTGGRTTITVAIDAGLEQAAKDAFAAQVKTFEKQNPGVTVKSQEYTWTGTTFSAELAGGTVPDVFTIPFTDGRGLIANKQVADISGLVADLPYAKDFNPKIAQAGEDSKGRIWAVPIAAYGQAVHYNRDLFEKAGLDPDKPPTTWAGIRTDAKKIADATGQAGYATMTTGNTGGWILTTLVNAWGGRTENAGGTKPTIDTATAKKVLEYLHDLRWVDDSMGSNFLYDWNGINQAFAAGQIGMYVSGGGNYSNLVTQNAIEPDSYGLTVLPLTGKDAGVLGGGTLAAVSPKATSAQQAAAVKWIDFYYLKMLTDKSSAQATAKLSASLDQPVGSPQLPVFNQKMFDEQQSWIKPYINVPVDQMTSYTKNVFSQGLVPEPRTATQDVYGVLDNVVQAVLTNKDADIDQLLAAAQTQAEAKYAAAK